MKVNLPALIAFTSVVFAAGTAPATEDFSKALGREDPREIRRNGDDGQRALARWHFLGQQHGPGTDQ